MRHTLHLDRELGGQTLIPYLFVVWDVAPDGVHRTGVAVVPCFDPNDGSRRSHVTLLAAALDDACNAVAWDDDDEQIIVVTGEHEIPAPLHRLRIDLRFGRVTPLNPCDEAEALASRLTTRFTGGLLDMLAELWVEGPRYADALPEQVTDRGTLVAWSEVSRSARQDLYVLDDDSVVSAEVLLCPNPDCTCKEVMVEFFELRRDPPARVFLGSARTAYEGTHGREVQLTARPAQAIPLGSAWDAFQARNPALGRFEWYADRTKEWAAPLLRGLPDDRGRVKIGRNEPCPCGSGKKYKRCCWADNQAAISP
jgi:hypothetical protein